MVSPVGLSGRGVVAAVEALALSVRVVSGPIVAVAGRGLAVVLVARSRLAAVLLLLAGLPRRYMVSVRESREGGALRNVVLRVPESQPVVRPDRVDRRGWRRLGRRWRRAAGASTAPSASTASTAASTSTATTAVAAVAAASRRRAGGAARRVARRSRAGGPSGAPTQACRRGAAGARCASRVECWRRSRRPCGGRLAMRVARRRRHNDLRRRRRRSRTGAGREGRQLNRAGVEDERHGGRAEEERDRRCGCGLCHRLKLASSASVGRHRPCPLLSFASNQRYPKR